jgi:hypothetical protein
MLNTMNTAVKDLKKGDKVIYYGSIFLITDDARIVPHHLGTVPVADCKRIETVSYYSSIDGILADYNGFQGLWNVAKIVD